MFGKFLLRFTIPLALFFLFMMLLIATTAGAESGRVRVVDGDTIEFKNGSMVRLLGIDAPEKKQTCFKASGYKWDCGKLATDRLKELVGGRVVTCDLERRQDVYGREIGVCHTNNVNINAWLVSNGYAEADAKYSELFIHVEAEAVRAKIGIWQGKHVSPRLWRKGVRE